MNEIINKTQFTLSNVELTKRMEIIRKELNGVLKSANVIGKQLSEIRAQELWKEDYNSFEECANIFGIKKAQAYNLIKGYEIGEKKLIRKSNGNPEKLCTEFSNTQCVEIAKLKEDTAILDALDNKEITPDMTTKEIRDVIEHKLHPEKFEEKEEIQELPETETETETETDTEKFDNIILQVSVHNGKLVIDTFESEIAAKDIDKIRALLEKYVK